MATERTKQVEQETPAFERVLEEALDFASMSGEWDLQAIADSLRSAMEEDRPVFAALRKATVVALLTRPEDDPEAISGDNGFVWIKGVGSVPFEYELGFAREEGDPPGTIRQVMFKGGWNASQWRRLDRSALQSEEVPSA